MRKIKTQEEKTKSSKIKQLTIGLIMILLLVLSYLGYAISTREDGSGNNVEYNGFEFVQVNRLWQTKIQEQVFYFKYLPEDVKNITVVGGFSLEDYLGKPLYFVNNNQASLQILNNLNKYIERYQEACLNNTDCSNPKLPVKTCEDNLIIFQEGETEIIKNNNCVYISGDVEKASDAFVYRVLGII